MTPVRDRRTVTVLKRTEWMRVRFQSSGLLLKQVRVFAALG